MSDDLSYIVNYLKNGETKLANVTTKKGDIFYTFSSKLDKSGALKIVLSRRLSKEKWRLQFVDIKTCDYYTHNTQKEQREILSYLIPIMQKYLFAGLYLDEN